MLLTYHIQCTKIDTDGINLSFIVHPTNVNEYLGTIRKTKHFVIGTYPESESNVEMVHLDSSFNIIFQCPLQENSQRTIYTSFTSGLEDCRIISSTEMTAVALDTNENWVPEMCLCTISGDFITNVKPMCFSESQIMPQKNWLLMSQSHNRLSMIYSFDPLRIISVDKQTGESKLEHYQKIFNLRDCEIHGGAAIYLEDKKEYLINVQVRHNHSYDSSFWILMNAYYKMVGYSKRFTFQQNSTNEMCMSLVEKNKSILASVTISNSSVYVYEFLLKDIYASFALV